MSEKLFLPHLLFEMAETFGQGVALRFGAEYGGRPLYIPQKSTPDHAIAKAFGTEVLLWLVSSWPKQTILIPLGPHSTYNNRIAEIRRLLHEGETSSTITRATGCHERTVRRHRRSLRERRKDTKQGSLF